MASFEACCAEAIRHLDAMFSNTTNEERANVVKSLEDLLQRADFPTVKVGVWLLTNPQASIQHQAQGGYFLQRFVRKNKGHGSHADLKATLLNLATNAPPTLHNLVVDSIVKAVRELALFVWPRNWPELLPTLLNGTFQNVSGQLLLMQQLAEMSAEPPYGALSNLQIRELRGAMKEHGAAVLQKAQAMLSSLMACTDPTIANSANYAAAFAVFRALLPIVPSSTWWGLGLQNMLGTVIKLPDCAGEAAEVISAILNSSQLKVDDPQAHQFVTDIASCIPSLLDSDNLVVSTEILDGFLSLPRPFLTSAVKSISPMCVECLKHPALFVANQVLEILSHCPEEAMAASIDPMLLLENLYNHVPKRVHDFGGDSAASQYTEEYYSTYEAYEKAFGDLRGYAAKILEVVASHHSELCARGAGLLIGTLHGPTDTDLRIRDCSNSSSTWLAHKSHTYQQWEGTFFMVNGMRKAYANPAVNTQVQQCMGKLFSELCPTDATLVPVYLDLLASFWTTPLPHWDTTISALFHYMQYAGEEDEVKEDSRHGDGARSGAKVRKIHADIDIMSARRRAYTLFIRATSDHADALHPFAQKLLEMLQNMIMKASTVGSEKSYLYEAMASLSNGMPADQQTAFLSGFVMPLFSSLNSITKTMTPEGFAEMLVSDSPEIRDSRTLFKESLQVLVGVLKRCQQSTFMMNLATQLVTVFNVVLRCLHSLATVLPPHLQVALQPAAGPGGGRGGRTYNESRSKNRDVTEILRSTLHNIRTAVYQGVGTLPKFLTVDAFGDMLVGMLQDPATMQLSASGMESLVKHCLVPLAEEYVSFLPHVFVGLTKFFQVQIQRAPTLAPSDESDARRCMSFILKMILPKARDAMDKHRIHMSEQYGVLAEFLQVVLASNVDSSRVTRLVVHLAKDCRENAMPLFSFCVQYAVATRVLSPREHELVVQDLADIYIHAFPVFQASLVQMGMAADRCEAMNHALLHQPRMDSKRRTFRNALMEMAK